MAIITDPFTGQPLEGKGETIKIDYAGRTDEQPVYVGFAEPDSATSEPVWKIMFCEYDGFPTGALISRTWAIDALAGKALYSQVWDDRTSLTYA